MTQLDAPLVFVGYGIRAPEYGYDDFAGVNLEGKIAVALSGAPLPSRPDFFPSTAHAHYASRDYKIRSAMAHGAKGFISVETPELDEIPWSYFIEHGWWTETRMHVWS